MGREEGTYGEGRKVRGGQNKGNSVLLLLRDGRPSLSPPSSRNPAPSFNNPQTSLKISSLHYSSGI